MDINICRRSEEGLGLAHKGKKFLAFDLGAESGRAIVGHFDGERIELEILHRFPNQPVTVQSTTYWDVLRLFHEMKQGLAQCVRKYGGDVASMAVDTWGVDFGLLGPGDELLGNPIHYRDPHTEGIMEEAFRIVPREELFGATGNQFMRFNTLFQLLALVKRESPLLAQAKTMLLMPNLFDFWFTGRKITEFTIASTTQMLNPYQRNWAFDLLDKFSISRELLTDVVEPGTVVGTVRESITEELGIEGAEITVIAPASHDTGSAVAAVPAEESDYVYISSGTWSLMGVEVKNPIVNEQSLANNFTNEGGVCGTYRFLKNIMGLWLVQQCRRSFRRTGNEYSYQELTEMAKSAKPLQAFIDPDADEFMNPPDMPEAIQDFCRRTDQPIPETEAELVRCCIESLALKYRWTVDRLAEITGRPARIIHMVGGGTQNELLCQLAADATGLPVVAGPIEATAAGNILMQAMALGEIKSLEEARQLIRRSFPVKVYEPQDKGPWDQVYPKFNALVVK
ncbi:MAG TPA: rhamnulokinase [Firmicutes bacterium]|nr:rhamnulokinase [Bacillota bacterium]